MQIGLVVTLVHGWVAYATYLERKISAFMQARLGSDARWPVGFAATNRRRLKLLTKEDFVPEKADRWIFFLRAIHCRRSGVHRLGRRSVWT